jgi:hypothetical protein
VHLPSFGLLEQVDLIEAEKRDLLMKFMDTVATVYAPNGPTDEARELIKRLRNVYFVGHEEVEKQQAEKAARELEALSRKVFTITPPTRKGGAMRLTVSDPEE